MRGEPAAKLRWLAGLILLVGVAAAIWLALDHVAPRPDWLQVEAPRLAVAGQRVLFRVRLSPMAEATRLCGDLHGGRKRDTGVKYLATGGSRAAGREGGAFDFEMKVPSGTGLRFVAGVFFLSPTENWRDRTMAASTIFIPVSTNALDGANLQLEPVALLPSGERPKEHSPPAAAPRWLTGLLFLITAVLAWGGSSSPTDSSLGAGVGHRWWRVLAVALALAGLWEVFGLESWIGVHARAAARAWELYYPRAIFQKAVVSAALVASILFFVLVRRARAASRRLLGPFALYLVIAVVNLISWHPIDNIADRCWHGLTLVQALKLGCAAMTLLAVRKAAGSSAVILVGKNPTTC